MTRKIVPLEYRCIAIEPESSSGCMLEATHVNDNDRPHRTAWGLEWFDAADVEYIEIGLLDDDDAAALRDWLTSEHREITATVERPGAVMARTEVVA
jgi:hypothetical protein